MIVSTNVLAYPKDNEPADFEANGLSYRYKQVQELTQANLVIEVITCTEEAKVAYISPEDFQDEATRLFLSSEIVNFLQELKILDQPEKVAALMDEIEGEAAVANAPATETAPAAETAPAEDAPATETETAPAEDAPVTETEPVTDIQTAEKTLEAALTEVASAAAVLEAALAEK